MARRTPEFAAYSSNTFASQWPYRSKQLLLSSEEPAAAAAAAMVSLLAPVVRLQLLGVVLVVELLLLAVEPARVVDTSAVLRPADAAPWIMSQAATSG